MQLGGAAALDDLGWTIRVLSHCRSSSVIPCASAWYACAPSVGAFY
jgi:hypothetical protein